MLRNIEAERVRRGFSQKELAEKLGTSNRTYTNWICEHTDIPATALIKMARLFNVSADYLLEGAKGAREEAKAV